MRGVIFLLGLVAYIGMTALCSVVSYTVVREVVIDTEGSGIDLPSFSEFIAAQPSATVQPQPTATPTNTPPPGVTFTPQPTIEPEPTLDPNDPLAGIQSWNDPRRVTILLMGIDQRSAVESDGPFFTDTMIVVQLDPINKTAGVLSVPRDLWVEIPGFRQDRINTANYLGDINELPQGGPGLAMETIKANLGINVDFYVRINFDVFTSVVDTIAPGGVEVCIEEAIFDDRYPDAGYGFITVQFDPGCQSLDSERLLQYARTRRTEGSDFDRNRRQQQVMQAVQAQVLSAGGILNFVTQIPRLYTELSGAYVTSLDLDTILRLIQLVAEFSTEDITYATVNNLHVDFATTEDGRQILIPRQDAIRQVVGQAFDPVRNASVAELRELALEENARIVVYNNTSVTGLAGQTQTWLTSRGVTISAVGNIDPPQEAETTIIRDYTGNLMTARYLAALFGLPQSAIRPGNDGLTSADVMVVVGADVQTLMSAQP